MILRVRPVGRFAVRGVMGAAALIAALAASAAFVAGLTLALLLQASAEERAAAARAVAANAIAADIAIARRAAADYVHGAAPEAGAVVAARMAALNGELDIIAQTLHADDAGLQPRALADASGAFLDAVALVAARTEDRDAAAAAMRRSLVALESDLTALAVLASAQGDANAAYRASAALSAGALAHMHMERYAAEGDRRDLSAADRRVQDARAHLTGVARRLESDEGRRVVAEAAAALDAHEATFKVVRDTLAARDSLVRDRLDVAGATMAELIDDHARRAAAQADAVGAGARGVRLRVAGLGALATAVLLAAAAWRALGAARQTREDLDAAARGRAVAGRALAFETRTPEPAPVQAGPASPVIAGAAADGAVIDRAQDAPPTAVLAA